MKLTHIISAWLDTTVLDNLFTPLDSESEFSTHESKIISTTIPRH